MRIFHFLDSSPLFFYFFYIYMENGGYTSIYLSKLKLINSSKRSNLGQSRYELQCCLYIKINISQFDFFLVDQILTYYLIFYINLFKDLILFQKTRIECNSALMLFPIKYFKIQYKLYKNYNIYLFLFRFIYSIFQ